MSSPQAPDDLTGTVEPPGHPTRALAVRARVVTAALLLAILGVSLAEAEEWPLSAFRLFSATRSGETISWQLVTVDEAGNESVVDLGVLPPSYGLVHHLLPKLPARSPAAQRAEIESWLEGAGVDVDVLASARVYRVVSTVPKTAGGTREVVERTIATEVAL